MYQKVKSQLRIDEKFHIRYLWNKIFYLNFIIYIERKLWYFVKQAISFHC